MKPLLFALLYTLMFSSLATAQTEKGSWQVGAQIGNLGYQKYNSGHFLTINLHPSVGYFPTKNLLVGLAVPFSSLTSSFSDPGVSSIADDRSIGIGPFIRYYLGNSRFKPFVGLGFTYNATRTRYDQLASNDNFKLDGRTTNFTPSVGGAYFINRNVLLSAGLNYNRYHRKYESLIAVSPPQTTTYTNAYQTFSFDVGFALLFGQ